MRRQSAFPAAVAILGALLGAWPAPGQAATDTAGSSPQNKAERTAKDNGPTNRLPTPTGQYGKPSIEKVDPNRFGDRPDAAYGAYQRGLYITALNLAMPRAENGDPAAQTLVAEIYSRGLGVAQDSKKAAKWYEKAAGQGVPEAQFQYALMLVDGRFVEKDEDKASALMKTAADNGNPLAQFNYAQMILDREPGYEGERKAADYYERAAKNDVPDAQYAMALIYANGRGDRQKNDARAREWLQRAASQNFDSAQVELGTWMVEGRGGEKDPKAGYRWLRRAAEGGNVAAENRLAKLYRAGVGVEADPVAAAAWYILARRAGLKDRLMEDYMKGLTREQSKAAIERANRLR